MMTDSLGLIRATILLISAGMLSCARPAVAGELSTVEPERPAGLVLPDLDGHPFDLGKLKGKVVVLSFWASWCTPCIEEMPSIQRLTEVMRDKPFAVVGVNVAEAERRVKVAVRRLGIGFPVLLDKDSTAFNRWKVTVLPTTYVLDRQGLIRLVGRGPLEWDGTEVVAMLYDLMSTAAVAETPQ